jgi:two-component system OmpR family sensor kinase/two-component system phosphate regulon sensor histidine kinase PhoR
MITEYFHERSIRIGAINEELGNYASIIDKCLTRFKFGEDKSWQELKNFNDLLPNRFIRITLIDLTGKVLYDSRVENPEQMENHLYRPEVQQSLKSDFGTNIRVSATTNVKYYYFAKKYNDYFVRVSMVFDLKAREFLQPDRIFMLFILMLFLLTSLSIVLLTDKFGKSVSTLREFTLKALENQPIDENIIFPENELGTIGQDIIDIYHKLNKTKEELLSEKSKLMRHLNLLDEGIAIFTKEKAVITNNNHFIQYVNHISDRRISAASEFFTVTDFSSLFDFVEKNIHENNLENPDVPPIYEVTMNKGGKYFVVRSIVFQDRSFEVSIQDITKPAKRKVLKQQMTENIAHELKTPVSSIKGFLETILNSNPEKEKSQDFLRRAYVQSVRLANLINDISLLTKIEEAGSLYQIEPVKVDEIIADIVQEIKPSLDECNIRLEISVGENIQVNGNPVLLYSVFRNLFDNAVSHAGDNVTVKVEKYMEDPKYYYFSFSDNGTGVPEKDLPRLFERFYRVDKGRDRKRGGTGLGLAIVKNAIQFHKGDISVKNRNEGGLEFLFSISKELRESGFSSS